MEQPLAELLLEVVHAAAQHRLRDVELERRAA
jgi:hypothetical protein